MRKARKGAKGTKMKRENKRWRKILMTSNDFA